MLLKLVVIVIVNLLLPTTLGTQKQIKIASSVLLVVLDIILKSLPIFVCFYGNNLVSFAAQTVLQSDIRFFDTKV